MERALATDQSLRGERKRGRGAIALAMAALVALCLSFAASPAQAQAEEYPYAGGYIYYEVVDGTAYIDSVTGTSQNTAFTVPSKIAGYPVAVRTGAFASLPNLTTLEFQDGVVLEAGAVINLENLTTVLPASRLKTDAEAFVDCQGINGQLASLTGESGWIQRFFSDGTYTVPVRDTFFTTGSGACKVLGAHAFSDTYVLPAYGDGGAVTAIDSGYSSAAIVDMTGCRVADVSNRENYRAGKQHGGTLKSVTIPEGYTSVNCALSVDLGTQYSVIDLYVAKSVTSFDMALPSSDNLKKLIIHAPEGSAAQAFCKSYQPGSYGCKVEFQATEGDVPSGSKIGSVQIMISPIKYTGKTVHPEPFVMSAGTIGMSMLKKGDDYMLSYSKGCIKPGTYTVTVTGKGKYKGSQKTVEFTIPYKDGTYPMSSINAVVKANADFTELTLVKPLKKNASVSLPATLTISTCTMKITGIGAKALKGNAKVKSLTLGGNIKKIGASAFEGCKNLKTITFKGSKAPSIGKAAFKGIYKKATFKVPSKLVKAYKAKLTSKTGFVKTMKVKKA